MHSEVSPPLPAEASPLHTATPAVTERRRKLDASALEDLELLLLRAGTAVAAFLAVRGVDAALNSVIHGPAFGGTALWSVLLPCTMLILPVRHYHGFADAGAAKALQWTSAVLNVCLGIGIVACVSWLLNAPRLPFAHAVALLASMPWLVMAMRALIRHGLGRIDRTQSVVIIGACEQGILTARHLALSTPHIKVVGFMDDRSTRTLVSELPAPWLGSTAQLDHLQPQPDGVVIALPNMAGARIHALAVALRRGCGRIYLAPDLAVLQSSMARHPQAERHRLMLLGMDNLPLGSRIVKRLFDIFFSLLALAMFLPLGLAIALLIKIGSPGPVFFVQQRYGMGHRLFGVFKFRSMTHDPAQASKGIELTRRGDARVTPIGDFLRRTSLDEVPQFINVLLGQMSVVGPRPHPPGVKAGERVYESVISEFIERYKVPAGITGWAQVNGHRGNTFTEEHLTERFAHDIQYIQNWSFELDLWIILKTALGGFRGHNAF